MSNDSDDGNGNGCGCLIFIITLIVLAGLCSRVENLEKKAQQQQDTIELTK